MKKVKDISKKIWLSLAIFVFVIPIFPLASDAKSYVYVDDDASGEMTGSSSHPFDSIQDAIDKAKRKHRDVYIRQGTYEENIVIYSNIEVYGSGRDEVVIKAHHDYEPVVEMRDNTNISKVTIKDGRYGVKVKEDDSAVISDCKIIDNDRDGIKAERASREDKYKLEIYDSFIAYNGWNGIYSEQRSANVKNNEIYDNGKDGVEFESKSEFSFEDNSVKDNDGVGLRVTIDESEAWIKNNTFRDNDKQGMEVRANGAYGSIKLKKNKFYKNDSWGIVQIETAPFSDAQWSDSLRILDRNIFWENEKADISPVINVY